MSGERLARVVGVLGAVLMGLGSIVGTGIFVSVGIAAGVAGPAVIIAVALAAVLATLNGLSSAQLAASHPVSGGTYEYGYEYLSPAGIGIAGLTLIGSVETTWSFSAFTVLVYYALTNLAALRLPAERRRYPRGLPALGLAGCLGLAFWVDQRIWLAGLALIALGLAWHLLARRRSRHS